MIAETAAVNSLMVPPNTSRNNLANSHDALHLLHGRLPCTDSKTISFVSQIKETVKCCDLKTQFVDGELFVASVHWFLLFYCIYVLTHQFSPFDFHTGDLFDMLLHNT